MAWFDYLKNEGKFDAINNPEPVKVGDNYIIPFWEPLDYLETIAATFQEGKNLELVPEILAIIKNVSEAANPSDNYHTWSKFIKILSLMPEDSIPLNFLDFIPVWVTSKFDTMLQTMEITRSLLAKFLKHSNNSESREKAERILSNLFQIRLGDAQLMKGNERIPYYSPFYWYYLKHFFHNEKNLKLVVAASSNSPLTELLKNINYLLRDHQILMKKQVGETAYIFNIFRLYDDLTFIITKQVLDEETILLDIKYKDYVDLEVDSILEQLNKTFTDFQIDQAIYQEVYDRLKFNLENDLSSVFGYEGIKDLDDDSTTYNVLFGDMALVLREWLVALVEIDAVAAKSFLEYLITEQKYNLPFFKRIVLYVVSKNWNQLREVFWKIIDDMSPNSVFSIDCYKLELYYLLSNVAEQLNTIEEQKLWTIIQHGPIGDRHDSASKEEWQHRWLTALQKNKFFNSKFDDLTQRFKTDNNYHDEGKIQVRVGNVAPHSTEELLEMTDDHLINEVLQFNTRNRWEDPTDEGFAENLGAAVEQDPERFSKIITRCNNFKYIYIYYILHGFSNAMKSDKVFISENVLNFISSYINSEKFINNELDTKDDLSADKNWVYSNLCAFISIGTKKEQNGFPEDALPICKQLLIQIFSNLPTEQYNFKDNTDFIMHELNCLSGQLLTAAMNYSLRYAKTIDQSTSQKLWDPAIKQIFEDALVQNIVASYTLLGKFLPQLMFLDIDWLKVEISKISKKEEIYWAAFMGGIGFGKPVSEEFYKLLYDSYDRAATTGIVDTHYNHGILRHFLAFYFWDFESSFEKSLLFKVLENADVNVLHQFVLLLSKQSKSFKNESLENKSKLLEKILVLWNVVNSKITRFNDPEDLKLLENIVYLTDFVE